MDTGSSEEDRIGPGAFLGIVGPSGAGKDSLLACARQRLAGDPRILFVRRIITRHADATEDNDHLTASEFARLEMEGGFAVAWRAHGLAYAIPASVDDSIRDGRIVMANISRAVIPQIRQRYMRGLIVLIDAPMPLRARRLADRGRESEADILARLSRNVSDFDLGIADAVIDNSGALEDAVSAFLKYVETVR